MPDIVLMGGVAVPAYSTEELRKAIEKTKASFASRRYPVKWNFKDLKSVYERHRLVDAYTSLLSSSEKWRRAIFEEANDYDFTIIVACVEAHSEKRPVLKSLKDELARYVFSDGLMRFALHVQETKATGAEVILDWPDKGRSEPFDSEYAAAYSTGKTQAGIPYSSGPLEPLGFEDAVHYASMIHSTLLQFSDLVVGATRGFLERALGKKERTLGCEMLTMLRRHIRGYPGRILGRGISVASAHTTFKSSIERAIRELLDVP